MVFRNIGREVIDFFRSLMKNPDKRNLTIDQKQILLSERFPHKKKLSRSTVYKVTNIIMTVVNFFIDPKEGP